MSELLKRGFSIYKIVIQNKLVAAVMMFVSGVMMSISGFTGSGNDTKTMPTALTVVGAALTLWGAYRIGFLRAGLLSARGSEEKSIKKRALVAMAVESVVYFLLVLLGVFLLTHEQLMNTVLNIMTGAFTILNGIFGVLYLLKNRTKIDAVWKFKVVLTLLEFILGSYFIISSETITLTALILLGLLTAVAGVLEIIITASKESLKNTVKDGQSILNTLKSGEKPEL
ncbi:DUF308 domain-containing protein [Candidatus Saccharibacteria bacterium]|nr:DUF308 domain-containing protein [Candidatus Saccharibacteria bacterium]